MNAMISARVIYLCFFLNPLTTFFTVYESYVLVTKCSHGLSKLSSLSPNQVPFWQLPTNLYLPFQWQFVGYLHRDSET